MRFEIYKDKAEEFRVRLVASNGETICCTEGYTSKQSAQSAINIIKGTNESTPVVENLD